MPRPTAISDDSQLPDVSNPRLSLFDDTGTRERQSALAGRIAEYAIITLVVVVIAGMEIARWAFDTPPQPILFSFVAGCMMVYSAARIALIWRQILVLRRERQARTNLHLAIEDICGRGWLYFDGLTDPRGHLLGSVLAGPGGIFCLVPRFIARGHNLAETVRREGDALLIGNHRVLADPVGQARRAARSLYEVLASEGLDTIPVQPAVVFPGWTVQDVESAEDESSVWVLSDRDLVPRVSRAPAVMEAKDLIAVSLLFEKLGRS